MNIVKKRIIVCGCKKIAIDIIDFIKNHNEAIGINNNGDIITAEIVAVVTKDEERDRLFSEKLVKEYCDESNIFNICFEKDIDQEFFKNLNPDVIFSAYYRKLFKKDILSIPKMGIINIHPSNLPENRGPNPTYWDIRRGSITGFSTLHYADEGINSGDIIASSMTNIKGMNGFQANKELMKLSFNIFKENYSKIMCEQNKREKQPNELASFNIAFNNEMRYIDWSESAGKIIWRIKAHEEPYNGTIACAKDGLEIIINKAQILEVDRGILGPGSYTYDEKSGILIIQTNTKPIKIDKFVCTKGVLYNNGRFV